MILVVNSGNNSPYVVTLLGLLRKISQLRVSVLLLFYSILFYYYSILLLLLFYSILFYSTLLYSTLLYSTLFYSILFYSISIYLFVYVAKWHAAFISPACCAPSASDFSSSQSSLCSESHLYLLPSYWPFSFLLNQRDTSAHRVKEYSRTFFPFFLNKKKSVNSNTVKLYIIRTIILSK